MSTLHAEADEIEDTFETEIGNAETEINKILSGNPEDLEELQGLAESFLEKTVVSAFWELLLLNCHILGFFEPHTQTLNPSPFLVGVLIRLQVSRPCRNVPRRVSASPGQARQHIVEVLGLWTGFNFHAPSCCLVDAIRGQRRSRCFRRILLSC